MKFKSYLLSAILALLSYVLGHSVSTWKWKPAVSALASEIVDLRSRLQGEGWRKPWRLWGEYRNSMYVTSNVLVMPVGDEMPPELGWYIIYAPGPDDAPYAYMIGLDLDKELSGKVTP